MSRTLLTHKEFSGSVDPSIEDECLHGRILFIDDVITYEGESVGEIKAAFVDAVERYLEYCKRTGKAANKPYSGSFNIRIGSELHRRAVVAASGSGVTLNEFVCQAIRAQVDLPYGRGEHLHTHIVTYADDTKYERKWSSSSSEGMTSFGGEHGCGAH